jgi:hypothetical protein
MELDPQTGKVNNRTKAAEDPDGEEFLLSVVSWRDNFRVFIQVMAD